MEQQKTVENINTNFVFYIWKARHLDDYSHMMVQK